MADCLFGPLGPVSLCLGQVSLGQPRLRSASIGDLLDMIHLQEQRLVMGIVRHSRHLDVDASAAQGRRLRRSPPKRGPWGACN